MLNPKPNNVACGTRAFTLIELLVVIGIIALLIGLLLPALGKSRRVSRNDKCMSNMRQFGISLASYASENRGAIGSFSWKPNKAYSQFPDLNTATNYQHSNANQAVDIIRRLTGHMNSGFYTRITGRIMNRHFNHLPFSDGGYITGRLPELITACPEDRDTLVWQRNYNDYAAGLLETGDPEPNSELGFKKVKPFWNTYQFVPTAWSPDVGPGVLSQASNAAGNQFLYNDAAASQLGFGGRKLDEVYFPSQKVAQFDLFDRHCYKRPIWYAYPVAAQPLLFFDSSVSIRRTQDCNPGWNPLTPTGTGPTTYLYWPTGNNPKTLSGAVNEQVLGYYRWTRMGIRGVDYAGGEVKYR